MSGPNWSRAGSGEGSGRHPVSLLCPAVVLVLVFGICWAPFHIDRLMWSFVSDWTDGMLLAFQYVHVVSGVFFYLSSAANPVLYSLMSSRFRDTFREALGLGARCHHRSLRSSSRSLSRVTTGSTLCDTGSVGCRAHPLPENCGPEGQQETDLGGASKKEEPEGHMQLWEPHLHSSAGPSSCLSPFVPCPHCGHVGDPCPHHVPEGI